MRIAVIGGGASGIMAAITAAELGARVTIIEKKDKIGKKILATGNGKCNFTNMNIKSSDYHSQNERVFKDYFSQFNENDTISLFTNWGMLVKNREGYCYPRSEQASTVLGLLNQQCKRYNITILTECYPEAIYVKRKGFRIVLNTKETIVFDRIIIATGSFAGERNPDSFTGYTYAKSLGHTLVPVVPSLVQVKAKEKEFKKVAGVRCHAAITLSVEGEDNLMEEGELQLTDYGISGIPVFQLSRYVSYGSYYKKRMKASIDFLPEISIESWEVILRDRWAACEQWSLEEFFLGFLNRKIIYMIITSLGYEPEASIQKYKLRDILIIGKRLKNWNITPVETKPFENAQVCAGGISMNELSDQLESKLVPNMFFCGEVLDVDGRCGGYNLQWAWTSGYIAGKHAAGCSHKGTEG